MLYNTEKYEMSRCISTKFYSIIALSTENDYKLCTILIREWRAGFWPWKCRCKCIYRISCLNGVQMKLTDVSIQVAFTRWLLIIHLITFPNESGGWVRIIFHSGSGGVSHPSADSFVNMITRRLISTNV